MRRTALLLAALALASCHSQETPAPPAPAAPSSEPITFETTPPGAQVELDGKLLPEKTPFTRELKTGEGTHHAKLLLDGYEPANVDFLVPLGAYTVRATLKVAPRIGVASEPPGAVVEVDGKVALAATPGDIALISGPHQVTIRKEGFVPVSLALPEGTKTSLSTRLVPAATLSVDSTPSGARVVLDGKDTGLDTPVAALPVAADRIHFISARKDGLACEPLRVKPLRPGKSHALSLALSDISRKQLLRRRLLLKTQLAKLSVQARKYDRKASAFVLKSARESRVDAARLDALDARIEALSAELADVEDQLSAER